ncbi:MAG: hypothetical protein WBH47_20325 [Streptosporangiaceae bacterium]
MNDTSATAARVALAAGLRASQAVAAAFEAVPRHVFLPEFDAAAAYRDAAVVTKSDADGLPVSAATQPAMMAVMLDQLGLAPGQRVLEIGTGTGFNAALLAVLTGRGECVVTVEVDAGVAAATRAALATAGYPEITVIAGDGALGARDRAPFDRIIVTAGAWDIPPAWLQQLAPGGRIVLPLSVRGIQLSVALDRDGERWVSGSACRCGFIRVTGPFGGPETMLPLGPQPGLHAESVDGTPPDAGELYRALSGPATEVPTGLRADDVAQLADLDLWLTLTEPCLGRLNLLGRHEGRADPGQRRIAGLMPLGGLVTAVDPGLLGIATLGPPADSGWGRPGPFEIVVRGYGPAGAGLADRLAERAAAWHAQARPGAGRLRITAAPRGATTSPAGATTSPAGARTSPAGGRTSPAGTRTSPANAELVIDRPHVRLSVGWTDG